MGKTAALAKSAIISLRLFVMTVSIIRSTEAISMWKPAKGGIQVGFGSDSEVRTRNPEVRLPPDS